MDSERYRISAQEFLERYHVLTYTQDAVAQLLEQKDENTRTNPAKFLAEYVRKGTHTVFREFSYIKATPHNRGCFITVFWKCYKQIGRNGDLLSVSEYHSLLMLICADFPIEMVQQAARIVLLDDSLDSLLSFTDFLFAFQIQLCYMEFLQECRRIYDSLVFATSGGAVVIPSGETGRPPGETGRPPHQKPSSDDPTQHHIDCVNTSLFLQNILEQLKCLKFSCPHSETLGEILAPGPGKVSFYGFLMALTKNENINRQIGALPSRDLILDDVEEETNKIVKSQKSTKSRAKTVPNKSK